MGKINRNAPCPCGSGKKFKQLLHEAQEFAVPKG
ncbi:MAG: SEC-C domain-containing protein [Planctomycetes bacterium]|nr:SEC-C domain-containing protein [Planctomycetota bacterium]